MEIKSLSKIFDIEILELEDWSRRPYQNNFFEIVYVENGRGKQCIAGVEFEYSPGNIFLLPPLNCHSFTITEHSKFYFIKFVDNLFLHGAYSIDYKSWFDNISYILANYNRVPGDIISSASERKYIINTIQSIKSEYLNSDNYSESIVSAMMASILNLLARNIEHKFIDNISEDDSRFSGILRYINNNLSNIELLKISALAEKFNISKSYFSEYFTKQSGMKLSEYIISAKLKLAETYILHTDQSLKEIAFSLGFTDSSHLSNSFKKHYGITVGEFRSNSSSLCRK